MTKAPIFLPSLFLIAALALSGRSLLVGGGSFSQIQGQQTQVSQAGSDSVNSTGSAQNFASASAPGTATSAGQAVAGHESGQIPPIPMVSLPGLSLLIQSTGAFTPSFTRSITFQPGVTARPTRCDASRSLIFGSTVLGGDGSVITSSGTTSATNSGDGSGTYSDGKISITVNGDGSGAYSDGKVSITVNDDGPDTYSGDCLSVAANGDDPGTYSDPTTGGSVTLDDKGSGAYSRSEVFITNNSDGSGTYSNGRLSITNDDDGTAIVSGSTISAKPASKIGKVGTLSSVDAVKPVRSCGTVTTLEDSILSGFDLSGLCGEASTTLTNLTTIIKGSKAPKVQIQGHTDSVSDDAFSQKLSEQRTQTASGALKFDGMAANLEAVGYGETGPVVPNESPDDSDSPAGHHLNCRVEVFVSTS